MSVTYPLGFESAGVACGLKSSGKKDLALIANRGPSKNAAAVFTTNRAKANPIIWSEEVIKDLQASAIVLNAGGANCYTGSQGFQTTHATAELVAELLGVSSSDVLVCSTGLIGEQLDRAKVLAGVNRAFQDLSDSGGESAALAIMTTDSVPKLAVRQGSTGWRLGGIAKGAGMLAPGLATMLVVITTDANVQARDLDSALREATRLSFDRLDSDGCMSTNDQVTLMSSGASAATVDLAEFKSALIEMCQELALKLLDDAEGASHNIHIKVVGAASEGEALEVARAIARNNLFKAAIYGNDPNWGRILAAIGTTKASYDPYDIDVSINGVLISSKGEPAGSRSLVDLSPKKVDIFINLFAGDQDVTVVTNDLTHAYVEENSAYSS
ncbi:bifunctional glutamate N-acetyltransferase/amino-acid acetyltransferase ArgJ [Candidatus Aquiluna sp. UB-MaderosW2red]|uniref:bifunctional glutamate N-acetyltransferase/amino-acid acetyltransferase ArgJ n=1 Tax=Candidatus Aquiluna sp. UB-MaderosW2red TaxID=1855377 RepID=UPI000875D0E2|nr:bifunctional glutamate N-acetyltransferase/amino-acid acetyltransferase ArgJ [Candidatus Aquiluna sp. UB-MaderosW2red]SCX13127.1 glutamate N-acetyltransferase / amino-acid N-acetyltransferase [Candidatus Aquiluna sp. UB-MaderosW2red]